MGTITALKCKYFNDYISKLALKYPLKNILLITGHGEFYEEKEQENQWGSKLLIKSAEKKIKLKHNIT